MHYQGRKKTLAPYVVHPLYFDSFKAQSAHNRAPAPENEEDREPGLELEIRVDRIARDRCRRRAGGGTALTASQVAHAADAGATEGDRMEFTIKLGAAPNGWAVRYKYKTTVGTAVEGEDYEEATRTVTFNSGVKE